MMRRVQMRKAIAAVLACTTLAGCVYAPPPGYQYVEGYGYVAPGPVGSGPVVTGPGRVEQGPPPAGLAGQGSVTQDEAYPQGYAYDPGVAVYAAPGYVAPGYVEAYPDYAGAAVTGLALGALAGAAIASTCCSGGHGGFHRR
jgi:hypothetical protein